MTGLKKKSLHFLPMTHVWELLYGQIKDNREEEYHFSFHVKSLEQKMLCNPKRKAKTNMYLQVS